MFSLDMSHVPRCYGGTSRSEYYATCKARTLKLHADAGAMHAKLAMAGKMSASEEAYKAFLAGAIWAHNSHGENILPARTECTHCRGTGKAEMHMTPEHGGTIIVECPSCLPP